MLVESLCNNRTRYILASIQQIVYATEEIIRSIKVIRYHAMLMLSHCHFRTTSASGSSSDTIALVRCIIWQPGRRPCSVLAQIPTSRKALCQCQDNNQVSGSSSSAPLPLVSTSPLSASSSALTSGSFFNSAASASLLPLPLVERGVAGFFLGVSLSSSPSPLACLAVRLAGVLGVLTVAAPAVGVQALSRSLATALMLEIRWVTAFAVHSVRRPSASCKSEGR